MGTRYLSNNNSGCGIKVNGRINSPWCVFFASVHYVCHLALHIVPM